MARAHEKGEHSRCLPSWCEASAQASLTEDQAAPVGAEPAPPSTAGTGYRVRSSALIEGDREFGPEGQELWDAVNPNGDLKPLQAALLREACRITDRLGALDRQLHGDGPWLELSTEDGVVWHVDVTDVLREARSQAGAFRSLVTELRQSSSTSRAYAPPAPDVPEGEGGGSVVDIGAAIRARLATQAEG